MPCRPAAEPLIEGSLCWYQLHTLPLIRFCFRTNTKTPKGLLDSASSLGISPYQIISHLPSAIMIINFASPTVFCPLTSSRRRVCRGVAKPRLEQMTRPGKEERNSSKESQSCSVAKTQGFAKLRCMDPSRESGRLRIKLVTTL